MKKAVENVEISRRMGIQKLRASKSAYLWPFLEWVNIALRHLLHNHGNIATERKLEVLEVHYALLLSNDFKDSLSCTLP